MTDPTPYTDDEVKQMQEDGATTNVLGATHSMDGALARRLLDAGYRKVTPDEPEPQERWHVVHTRGGWHMVFDRHGQYEPIKALGPDDADRIARLGNLDESVKDEVCSGLHEAYPAVVEAHAEALSLTRVCQDQARQALAERDEARAEVAKQCERADRLDAELQAEQVRGSEARAEVERLTAERDAIEEATYGYVSDALTRLAVAAGVPLSGEHGRKRNFQLVDEAVDAIGRLTAERYCNHPPAVPKRPADAPDCDTCNDTGWNDVDGYRGPCIDGCRPADPQDDGPEAHTSTCDQGPNHPGPCHPLPTEQAAQLRTEAWANAAGPQPTEPLFTGTVGYYADKKRWFIPAPFPHNKHGMQVDVYLAGQRPTEPARHHQPYCRLDTNHDGLCEPVPFDTDDDEADLTPTSVRPVTAEDLVNAAMEANVYGVKLAEWSSDEMAAVLALLRGEGE